MNDLEASAAAVAALVIVISIEMNRNRDRRLGRVWAGPITAFRGLEGAYRTVDPKLILNQESLVYY